MSTYDLGEYKADIVVDDSKFMKGMDTAEKRIGKLPGIGKSIAGTVTKTILGLTTAVVGVGTASFAMTKKVTESFDKIAKHSAKLGVTTDTYQVLDYWASQNGISAQSMERAVGRLNQRIGMAKSGNEKYANALKALGVDMEGVKNGTVSTEDALAKSLETLSSMTNEQEKSALAAELFGTKMARDLMPALQDGSMSFEEAKQKAEELGIVIGEDMINSGVEFQDNLTDLKMSLSAVGQNIMANLIPIFNTFTNWILDNMPTIQNIFQTVFDVIGTVFGNVIGVVQSVIEWFQTWFETNEETLNGIWETIVTVFEAVSEFITEIWTAISEFWKENGQAMLDYAISIFSTWWETTKTVFNAIYELIKHILSLILPYIRDVLNRIRKFWDENGKQIMEAVKNAFQFIKSTIETVMPIIKNVISTAWNVIRTIFDTTIGVIMGLIKTFASILTGDFNGLKAGLMTIWNSLWSGIKGVVSGAWNMLKGAFTSLWNNIKGWFGDLGNSAVDWGKDLIRGFFNGMKNMGSWLKQKVTDLVKKIIPGPIRKVLGISSPSRLMIEYGEDTMEGMDIGLDKMSSKVLRTSERFATSLADKLSTPILTPQVRQLAGVGGYTTNSNVYNNTHQTDHSVHIHIENLHGTTRQDADNFVNKIEDLIKRRGY